MSLIFLNFGLLLEQSLNVMKQKTQIIWHVEQTTCTSKMVTDVTCEKKDMLFINYEAPTGEKKFKHLWNGGNGVGTVKLYRNNKLIDEIEAKNCGCEYGEFED